MRAITTIKLQKSTKSALDSLKVESESYDSAIRKLISNASNSNLKVKLIEAYRSMGRKELQLLQEWEDTSSEVEDYG